MRVDVGGGAGVGVGGWWVGMGVGVGGGGGKGGRDTNKLQREKVDEAHCSVSDTRDTNITIDSPLT